MGAVRGEDVEREDVQLKGCWWAGGCAREGGLKAARDGPNGHVGVVDCQRARSLRSASCALEVEKSGWGRTELVEVLHRFVQDIGVVLRARPD